MRNTPDLLLFGLFSHRQFADNLSALCQILAEWKNRKIRQLSANLVAYKVFPTSNFVVVPNIYRKAYLSFLLIKDMPTILGPAFAVTAAPV